MAHEALKRNKEGKFYQEEAMSEIESKVSGGYAQKVGVMEGDKVSSSLSSLCVKLQFQIIIQYSGATQRMNTTGNLRKILLTKENSFEEEGNIRGITTGTE